MHPQDAELFSAMQTVEISKKMTRKKPVRFDIEEGKWTSQAMSRLVKSKRLTKKGFRYYTKLMNPSKTGFITRWYNYLERYTEVFLVSSHLQGKTDLERIELCFAALGKAYGILTKVGIANTESFTTAEGEKVAQSGFVGLSKSEMASYLTDDGFITDLLRLSCFVPSPKMRLLVLRTLQTYGFLLYEPETNITPGEVGFIALIGQPEHKRKKAA